MKTYAQHRKGEISHSDFYSQFVTHGALQAVIGKVGTKALLESTDENLNDIPLRIWDSVAASCNSAQLREAMGTAGVSLGNLVCVAKAAARAVLQDLNK